MLMVPTIKSPATAARLIAPGAVAFNTAPGKVLASLTCNGAVCAPIAPPAVRVMILPPTAADCPAASVAEVVMLPVVTRLVVPVWLFRLPAIRILAAPALTEILPVALNKKLMPIGRSARMLC